MLPLAILGVVGSCYRRIGIGVAVYAPFVLAVWWLFTHRIDRFWIPIFPVLAFLAGLAVSPGAFVTWHWPLKVVLAGGLLVNLILIVAGSSGDIAYLVSLDRLEHDSFRVRAGHRYLNEHLSDDDLVLLVGDAEVFDLRVPILYNTVFDRDRFEALMAGHTTDEQHSAGRAGRDARRGGVERNCPLSLSRQLRLHRLHSPRDFRRLGASPGVVAAASLARRRRAGRAVSIVSGGAVLAMLVSLSAPARSAETLSSLILSGAFQ